MVSRIYRLAEKMRLDVAEVRRENACVSDFACIHPAPPTPLPRVGHVSRPLSHSARRTPAEFDDFDALRGRRCVVDRR